MRLEDLWLEITEIGDPAAPAGRLYRTDGAAGYSSLNKFKDAVVEIIKLDMGVISSNESNVERSGTVITLMINLLHFLNISVIVEGVETRLQIDFLKFIDTRSIQGYHFSRSIPEED